MQVSQAMVVGAYSPDAVLKPIDFHP